MSAISSNAKSKTAAPWQTIRRTTTRESLPLPPKKLSEDVAAGKDSRAIVAGASGQGEAIVANRFKGVRCALYYGDPGNEQIDASGKHLDILVSTREHNNANALSLGLRFLTLDQAKDAVTRWLAAPFPGEARHARRISQIDQVS